MMDIVEKLRDIDAVGRIEDCGHSTMVCANAADEIERQAARIAELEKHLEARHYYNGNRGFADLRKIEELNLQNAEIAALVEAKDEALKFYAEGSHFVLVDEMAWDTVSGEPPNYIEDDANTVTIEDGSVAKQALALTGPDALRLHDEQVKAEFLHASGQWIINAATLQAHDVTLIERCAKACKSIDVESFGVLPIRAVMIAEACADAIRDLLTTNERSLHS